MNALKKIQKILAKIGIGVIRESALKRLISERQHFCEQAVKYEGAARDLKFLMAMPPECSSHLVASVYASRSQFRQDLFALVISKFKRGGFFVEFGATDGVSGSNTHLLEKHYGWTGILAEPARVWHENLEENRFCIIDKRCVWSTTGERMYFNETELAALSSLANYCDSDRLASARKVSKSYLVDTVSLQDLLIQHGAPREIDYLSMDTEGSELDILSAFDFKEYYIKYISVEHNYSESREAINKLLQENGYSRVHEELSSVDDWYVLKESV